MSYYSIRQIASGEVWTGVVAEDASGALLRFGQLIGKPLTLTNTRGQPDFLLAEHHDPGPHFVDFSIPVFRSSARR